MKLHPAPTPELQALREARMLAYKRYWKAARDNGYVAIIRKRDGLRRLQEQVQTDLAHAQFPTTYWHPARPITGRHAGPDTSRHPYDRLEPGAVEAWIAEDPFVREGHKPHIAAHLTFIDTFKPRPLRPTHG